MPFPAPLFQQYIDYNRANPYLAGVAIANFTKM
jgi:hypothetical protein